MSTKIQNVLLLIAASATVACATSEGPTPDAVKPQAEIGPVDSMIFIDTSEASVDTSVVDMGADVERCVYPATESKPCGRCGTMSRFCLPEGAWTGFTACSGEIADAECSVGEKRTEDCGNCGKQTDFCDVKTCTWTAGFCAGEGPCAPGDEETTKASCVVSGEVRARKCDDKCQWSDFSSCDLPRGWLPMATAPITGRGYHSAVWTGTNMLIWGGGYSSGSSLKNDGASYNLAANTWKTIATPSLAARRNHRTVWTGSKMIVWGGYDGSSAFYKDGSVYDPATDVWTNLPTSPLSARHSPAMAWSPATSELLVWGGCTSGWCTAVVGDGAAYNADTGSWSALPPPPTGFVGRTDMAYTWSGTELIIWGGRNASSTLLTDGARFNPVTRAWTTFSAPSSSVLDGRIDATFGSDGAGGLFVWGGRATTSSGTASNAKSNGAIYTPGVGWTAIPAVPGTLFASSSKRYDVPGIIAKGKLWLLDGIAMSEGDFGLAGFVSYDVATGNWTDEPQTGAPSPGTRGSHSVVWTGRELLFFGGINGHTCCTVYNNGGIYRP